jgi:hypothetical protein
LGELARKERIPNLDATLAQADEDLPGGINNLNKKIEDR